MKIFKFSSRKQEYQGIQDDQVSFTHRIGDQLIGQKEIANKFPISVSIGTSKQKKNVTL